MKNLFVIGFLVCVVLVCLSHSSEAHRRQKHSRDVDKRQSRQNQRMRGSGQTKMERQERRRTQMKRKDADNVETFQHNRRMKKIKDNSPNAKGKHYRQKNRRKQRKNRRKHPLRLHRTKKMKQISDNITEPVQNLNITGNKDAGNTSVGSLSQTEEVPVRPQEVASVIKMEVATSAATTYLQKKNVFRKTVVGGSNSPCVSTSDCLPGHCCITKPNKGSRCKEFAAPAGKKCWDTCMCANGMECFVKNKREYGKHRRIRKKGKKPKGLCKIPETDDVIKGIYLKM